MSGIQRSTNGLSFAAQPLRPIPIERRAYAGTATIGDSCDERWKDVGLVGASRPRAANIAYAANTMPAAIGVG
jgi:hypothetical protein